MKLHTIAFALLIIGGINWLLEAFHIGLDRWITNWTVLMVVYILVGLAALYEVFTHKSRCKNCEVKNTAAPSAM